MYRDDGGSRMAAHGWRLTDGGSRTPKHPVRHEGEGGRDTPWLLAPRPSANLLPVAKFVRNGFLINQLGQVDLRLAPLDTRQSVSLPPSPSCRTGCLD